MSSGPLHLRLDTARMTPTLQGRHRVIDLFYVFHQGIDRRNPYVCNRSLCLSSFYGTDLRLTKLSSIMKVLKENHVHHVMLMTSRLYITLKLE